MNGKIIFQLLRVQQWYKNLVVFLALFFSGNLFQISLFGKTILAFISLSLISSAGYILNDLRDQKGDSLHPERRFRPIAAGKVKTGMAVTLAFLCLSLGFALGYSLHFAFFFAISGLFLLTQVYTFFLKKVLFADVIAIASLFVVRAIAGALAIAVFISPWLIFVPFFLSLFMSVGKRHSELHFFGEHAAETKPVLKEYNHEITSSLMNIATVALLISYAFYSFQSEHPLLMATIPFALFTIFRFFSLIVKGSIIARQPERMIFDKPLIVGIVLWFVLAMAIIYFPQLYNFL